MWCIEVSIVKATWENFHLRDRVDVSLILSLQVFLTCAKKYRKILVDCTQGKSGTFAEIEMIRHSRGPFKATDNLGDSERLVDGIAHLENLRLFFHPFFNFLLILLLLFLFLLLLLLLNSLFVTEPN